MPDLDSPQPELEIVSGSGEKGISQDFRSGTTQIMAAKAFFRTIAQSKD
jgi:hypothetical protein